MLERGRYGIEYDPRQRERSSGGLGWVVALVAALALVSLTWTLVARVKNARAERRADEAERAAAARPLDLARPDDASRPAATNVADATPRRIATNAIPVTSPASPRPRAAVAPPPAPPLDPALARRSVTLRNLLMRLDEAERQHALELAVTTIESIRALPGAPAADLDDALARRLGRLNMRRLFEQKNAQWVAEVVLKSGDSASRLASEYGSTLASLRALNGGAVDRLIAGHRLYVMRHPRFNLVVHHRQRTADLQLNGKFFKRYDLTGPLAGKAGAYETEVPMRKFWTKLGIRLKNADRAELEMLLPRGTSVIVSEM